MKPVKLIPLIIVVVAAFSVFLLLLPHKGDLTPETLVRKAGEFLKSKFGEDYVDEHLSFNSINGTTVIYDYNIKAGDYSTTKQVTVKIGGDGSVSGSSGVVDCVADSSKCMPYDVDRDGAIDIAKAAGLEEGTIGYGANIQYYEDSERYVWDIRNLKKELENPPEEGEGIWIDPATGEVVGNFTYPEG